MTIAGLDKMKDVIENLYDGGATEEEKSDVIEKIEEVRTWFNEQVT